MASKHEQAGMRLGEGASDAPSARLPLKRGIWPGRQGPAEPRASAVVSRRAVAPSVVLLVSSIAVFMAFLDDTVVGIAFPNMLRSFPHATVAGLSWVFNAYNITFAAFLVPAGRFADLLGRRRSFAFGVALFTLASGLCAAAPSPAVLIGARGLQGVGAAIVVPASLALVLKAYPGRDRVQAVGLWAATAAVAAGVGPSIGGLLVYAYNWRLVFLINVPIGVLAWWLAGSQLVESRAPGRRELPDLTGALMLAGGVTALSLALAQGPVWGWASPGVLAAGLAAVAAAILFARRCARHPSPVLDLDMLRAPRFAVTGLLTLVGSAGFTALGLANVFYLMQVWHYSPLTAGLALTPAPFIAAPTAVIASRLAVDRDVRKLIALGALILASGAGLLIARMGVHPDYLGSYLPAGVLLAVGIGIAFPLVSDAAVADAPRSRFAGATALNTAIRLLGAALGVAILAALLGHASALGVPAPFRHAWLFAGISFAVLAVVALRLPSASVSGADAPDEEAAPTGVRPLRRARSGASAAKRSRPPTPWAPASAEEMLASVPLFANMSGEIRSSLAARSDTVWLHAGEWLVHRGEEADALYVLRTGRLEVLHETPKGQQRLLRELGAGSVIGELALLSGGQRSASVRCRRDAELLRLPRAEFDGLFESVPGFAADVSRSLALQLQRSAALDTELVSTASTVAVVAPTGRAARESAGLERLLLRELGQLSHVAHLDRAQVAELHPDVQPGVALARTLDRLERDHELVLVSAVAADDAWTHACVQQADRVLLIVSGAPPDPAAIPSALEGCDAVLLEPAGSPEVRQVLERLGPRSTHRVAPETLTSDVARLARRLTSRSVGLVLSGGGARAFAHIGVIEELQAAGVALDRVAGSSMGAFIGALLAQGMGVEEIDARCYEEWVRRSPLSDYRLPRHALLAGARLRAMLERNLGGAIEDLHSSYFCVSVDLLANELVVHRRGDLVTAVAGSMAVPGVLPPVIAGERLLVDGAVFDGLPVSIMAAEEEGPIIASDVTERKLRARHDGEGPRLPTLMDTLANLAFLGTTDTTEEARRHADLLISPEHETVGAMEFHMLDSLREAGRRAALLALEQAPAGALG